jgi:hypothetical protein
LPREVLPLTEEELALYRVVLVRPIFSEFVRRSDRVTEDRQFRLWDGPPGKESAQIREMNREDNRKRRFQGRDLGKSITMTDEFNSMVLLYDGGEDGVALMGTRASINLNPIFEKQVALWTRNRFLSKFLIPDSRRAVDMREHQIRLMNGRMTIVGRIQGQDGQGFNTVHPNVCAWIDEAQYISDASIAQFYGMISPALPVLASGVPNGVPTSWAYKIDNDESWGFRGSKMTRLEDPRVYLTPGGADSLAKIYGGEHTNLYKHLVLGEWGADSRMTFNMDLIEHDIPGEVPRPPAWWRTVDIDMIDYRTEDLAAYFEMREDLDKSNISNIFIHADFGLTGSPTSAYLSYFDRKEQCWRQYIRFYLRGMQIQEQVEVFNWVARDIQDTYGIKPTIGIDTTDTGGQGLASGLERLKWKVHWANLGEKVKFEQRLESNDEIQKRMAKEPFGDPTPQWLDIENWRKEVAMQRLAKELYGKHIRLVEDERLWAQFASTTDHPDTTGRRRIYETEYTENNEPYDHDLAAFQVWASMIHEQKYEGEKYETQKLWSFEVPLGWGEVSPLDMPEEEPVTYGRYEPY